VVPVVHLDVTDVQVSIGSQRSIAGWGAKEGGCAF